MGFPDLSLGLRGFACLDRVCLNCGKPQGTVDANEVEVTKRAGLSSLKMGITGSILLSFIVFHLLHFTIRTIYPEYGELMTLVGSSNESPIHDVYSMVLAGFQHTAISLFYIVAMFLLCTHLAHGVSSVFQSLGLRSNPGDPIWILLRKDTPG